MCFSNLYSYDLIALSSSLAIYIGEQLSSEELATLSAFFSSLGDNLAIISSKKI